MFRKKSDEAISQTKVIPRLTRRRFRRSFSSPGKPLYVRAGLIREPAAFRNALIDEAGLQAGLKKSKRKMRFSVSDPTPKDNKALERQSRKAQRTGRNQKGLFVRLNIFWKIVLGVFAFCCVCGFALLAVFITWMLQAPEINMDKFAFNSATVIYDNSGNYYQELQGTEKRIPIEIDEVPELVQLAFISIEDQRFYSHFGVDIRGTLKAVVSVLTSGSTDGPGGSTITQQLIKQTHLTSEVSVKRKVMEWFLSVKLENLLSKREILEAYLNKANMSEAWGIEAAAQQYFGISTKELSLAQAAVLAGIVNSPAYYNPYDYEEDEEGNYYLVRYKNASGKEVIGYSAENLERALIIIDKMYELGHISELERDIARKELTENLIGLSVPKYTTVYTYFTDAVYQQVIGDLMSAYNYSEDDATDLLLNGGLNVYSTVDTVIQKALEKQAANNANFPGRTSNAKAAGEAMTKYTGTKTTYYPQIGGAIIENKTGYVSGIIGGRSKTVSLSMNRGLEHYQVGSTTKPITVYAGGIDSKVISLASVFDNSRYRFGSWSPVNDGGYSGMTTVRSAIRYSINIVAVLTQKKIGDDKCVEYALKFGLDLKLDGKVNDKNSAALALGGYCYGQTPLAMASAYTVFPNGGYRLTPTFYTHITDSNGVTILSADQKKIQVVSPQAAWIVTSALRQVVQGGTTYVSVSGQQVGGKTGTTDKHRCVWFCGFTPKYTGAFWMGYDYNSVKVNGRTYQLYVNTSSGYSRSPANFWRKVFRSFYKTKNIKSANLPSRPKGVATISVDAESGMLPGKYTKKIASDYGLPGSGPDQADTMHKPLIVCSVSGKLPNEFCATEERIFFIKDDSILLPPGTVRLTGKSKYPKETDICLSCTAESTGANVSGVSFSSGSCTLQAGSSASYTLKDSSGANLSYGSFWAYASNNNVSISVSGNTVTIRGVSAGSSVVTGLYTYNAGTSKEVTYSAKINVTVTAPPVVTP